MRGDEIIDYFGLAMCVAGSSVSKTLSKVFTRDVVTCVSPDVYLYS